MMEQKIRTKEEILDSLVRVRGNLDIVIANLSILGTGNSTQDRIATIRVTFSLFDVIDELVDTEANIYNFLRREQRGVCTKEETEERA